MTEFLSILGLTTLGGSALLAFIGDPKGIQGVEACLLLLVGVVALGFAAVLHKQDEARDALLDAQENTPG